MPRQSINIPAHHILRDIRFPDQDLERPVLGNGTDSHGSPVEFGGLAQDPALFVREALRVEGGVEEFFDQGAAELGVGPFFHVGEEDAEEVVAGCEDLVAGADRVGVYCVPWELISALLADACEVGDVEAGTHFADGTDHTLVHPLLALGGVIGPLRELRVLH